jgi:hypothetical protein
MCHRIRLAMQDGSFGGSGPLGGEGKIVEADETYYGPTEKPKPLLKPRSTPYTKGGHTGPANKRAIVALVERGGNISTARKSTCIAISRNLISATITASDSDVAILTGPLLP